ncbi:unnamed protein product [Calicophoron daubneyi]
MDLFVPPSSEGIIPFDFDSVIVLCYVYLGRCPVAVDYSLTSDVSLKNLPLLRHGELESRGVKDILTYLRKQNYGLEYSVTDAEGVQLAALVSTIERQITPAVEWFMWGEDEVFTRFTGKLSTKSRNCLSSFYLTHRWRNKKIDAVKHANLSQSLRTISDAELAHSVYNTARRCLTTLSYILGKNRYIVGNKPTAVDAYLFARMWPLLLYESRHGTVDWTHVGRTGVYGGQSASHPLISHLLQCPNLVSHFSRILDESFPKSAACFIRNLRPEDRGFVNCVSAHPVRDCIVFGIGITGLFIAYARYAGLIGMSYG